MEVMTFTEFSDTHGDYVSIREGRMVEHVFADAAKAVQYQDFLNNQQTLYFSPPPADSREGLELLRKFHRAKVFPLQAAFNRLRHCIERGAFFVWDASSLGADAPPDRNCYGEPDQQAMLAALKAMAGPHNRKLREIETKLEAMRDVAAEQETRAEYERIRAERVEADALVREEALSVFWE